MNKAWKWKTVNPFGWQSFLLLIKLYIAKVAFSAFGCKNYNLNSDEVFFQGCAWLMGSKVILKNEMDLALFDVTRAGKLRPERCLFHAVIENGRPVCFDRGESKYVQTWTGRQTNSLYICKN